MDRYALWSDLSSGVLGPKPDPDANQETARYEHTFHVQPVGLDKSWAAHRACGSIERTDSSSDTRFVEGDQRFAATTFLT